MKMLVISFKIAQFPLTSSFFPYKKRKKKRREDERAAFPHQLMKVANWSSLQALGNSNVIDSLVSPGL